MVWPHIPSSKPRLTTMVLLSACLVCVLLLTSGCTIEEPALPSFTTQLAIPLGSHDLTVGELIEDQDFLYAGGDSVLCFSVEGDTTQVNLDLDFSAELDGIDTRATIGAFALDDLPALTYAFTLADLWPAVGSLPPGAYPVPPFDFDLQSDPLDIDGFVSAQVASGLITLTLTNDMPIPLSGTSPPEMITVDIRHPDTDALVTTLVFDQEIAPGTSVEATGDLAGVELPGSLYIDMSGGSAGAPAVELDPADALAIDLVISDLIVDEASAVIGAQSFAETGAVALPDSLRIVEAVVASGTMDVTLTNELPLAAAVYIYFNEFKTAAGDPFILVFDMPSNGIQTTVADLAGAVITAGSGAPLDSLSYTVGVTSPGSDGEIVTVIAGSDIAATMAPTSLSLGEITGLIPRRGFALEPMIEEIDIPDELDGLHLAAASLTVDLYNGTGISGEVSLLLTARNAAGETASLATTANIAPARAEGMARTTIHLDETNSTIAELISLLPETLTFSGEISVGGNNEIGTIRPDDMAMVLWRADAPLRLSIESTEIDRDPAALNLDEDLRDQLDSYLQAAEIIVEIGNHFPFDLSVEFLVGPDSLSTINDPELTIGPLTVTSGLIGETSRYVEETVTTRHVITLTGTQIRAFTRENTYTALRALIPGTDGAEVMLRTGDGLSALGALSVEILIDED